VKQEKFRLGALLMWKSSTAPPRFEVVIRNDLGETKSLSINISTKIKRVDAVLPFGAASSIETLVK
jgi:hypothetical protein